MSKTEDEIWLELLAKRRAELISQPWTKEASREVERIDADMETFWSNLEKKAKPDAE